MQHCVAMLSQYGLNCPPTGIFIAVEQNADEHGRGLPAGNAKQRRPPQMPPEFGGRDIKQHVGKAIDVVELRTIAETKT